MAIDWYGEAMERRIRQAVARGLAQGIGLVEQRVIYLTTQSAKTGRKYRRRGVVHQASAPYEPFASDTGDTLARREIKVDPAALRATLIFRSNKARWLELGTRKMRPRPFARRALAETRQQVQDAVAGEIIAELRRP